MQTTAYHPQSNCMVERFHRELKAGLCARCSGADWLEHLPWVLLGLHVVTREEAGVSAPEAMYCKLSGAAQPAAATSTCTTGRSSQGGHSQHSQASQGGGKSARCGDPGGVPRICATCVRGQS